MTLLDDIENKIICLKTNEHIFWSNCSDDCRNGSLQWCCKCYSCGQSFNDTSDDKIILIGETKQEWETGNHPYENHEDMKARSRNRRWRETYDDHDDFEYALAKS